MTEPGERRASRPLVAGVVVAGVVVRTLVPDDVERLVELEGELFGAGAWSRASLAAELVGPGRWYVGAASGREAPGAGEQLVGYAGTWFDGEDAQVMTIGVSGSQQGRGIGRVLLDTLVAHSREQGARSLLLEVREDNVPAIALYESTGFVRMGVRRRYYQPEDVDALTMRLDLSAAAQTPTTDEGATT